MAFCKFSPGDRMIDTRASRLPHQFMSQSRRMHDSALHGSTVHSVASLSSLLLVELSILLNLVVVPVISIISLITLLLILA